MKSFNYSIMIVGMLLLLEYGGIIIGTNILSIVGVGTDSFGVSTGNFMDFIFGRSGILFSVGALGGLFVGVLARTSPENYIILPFITGVLGVFVGGFYGVVQYLIANVNTGQFWIAQLMILILAPLTIGYVFSLVEFFRGTD